MQKYRKGNNNLSKSSEENLKFAKIPGHHAFVANIIMAEQIRV